MDFETAMRALAALVLLFLLVRAGRALQLGRLKVAGEVYSRDDQPRRYWGELAVQLIFGLAIAAMVAIPAIRSGPPIIGLLVGTLIQDHLARHDWRDQRSPSQRQRETGILVFAILSLGAAMVAVIWFFFLRT